MSSYYIEKRPRANGAVKYRCVVVVKAKGKVIHRESKTFDKKGFAETWGKRRSNEIDLNGISRPVEHITVGELIKKYLADSKLGNELKRTKRKCLEMLLGYNISSILVSDFHASDVIQHMRERIETGVSPATTYHDYSYLKSVFTAAKPVWNLNISEEPFLEAKPMLEHMKLIGKSKRRDRRPTGDEVARLLEELKKREKHRSSIIPISDIFQFSILTCMRIGEVCKLRWADLDKEKRTILVRDRKDPRKKIGNHMRVPLLGDAFSIVIKQPKDSELVFPYNPKSTSSAFQRVRTKLGIQDLRYHDLRREGASRLFEAGYRIEEVAQVTGHKDIKVLWNVYTELYPENLHRDNILPSQTK